MQHLVRVIQFGTRMILPIFGKTESGHTESSFYFLRVINTWPCECYDL